MKTLLPILLLASVLFACTPSQYSHAEFKAMQEASIHVMDSIVGDSSVLYRMFEPQDDGGESFALWRKKDSPNYLRLKEGAPVDGYDWEGKLLKLCRVGEPKTSGRWLVVREDQLETGEVTSSSKTTLYHSQVPDSSLLALPLPDEEGLYKWEEEQLAKVAELSDYCDMRDLDAGIYYLPPPAIFYKWSTDVDILHTWKR